MNFVYVDAGIREAVEILNAHGFKTFESCEGGDGHCFTNPTVRFEGTEYDLLRAYDICRLYKLCVGDARRVYRKQDVYKGNNDVEAKIIGEVWENPFNEIEFFKHSETGTIFFPD